MPFDAKEELKLIGEQLKQARKEQKQTQNDIARRVGVGKMTISGLEAGKSNSFDNIGLFAEQMGYDLKLVPRSETTTNQEFEIKEHDEQILIAKQKSTGLVMVFNIDKTTLDYGLFTKDPEPEVKERFKNGLLTFIKKSIINQ
jgi:transcriptional regulator with XRE-family HTH domain